MITRPQKDFNPIVKQLLDAGPAKVLDHLQRRDLYERAKLGEGPKHDAFGSARKMTEYRELWALLYYMISREVELLGHLAEGVPEVLPDPTSFEPGYERELRPSRFDLVEEIFALPSCVLAAHIHEEIFEGYLYLLIQEIWGGFNQHNLEERRDLVFILTDLFRRRHPLPLQDTLGAEGLYALLRPSE